MQPTYYNQVFNTIEAWVTPKSRQSMLESYFIRYLPSFTSLFPQSVYGFIRWEPTYEQLLSMFESAIPQQLIRQRNRAFSFIQQDTRAYWPRSMAPIPEKYERIPLIREQLRFMEVFWPDATRPLDRVPGTIQSYRDRIAQFQVAWAW